MGTPGWKRQASVGGRGEEDEEGSRDCVDLAEVALEPFDSDRGERVVEIV